MRFVAVVLLVGVVGAAFWLGRDDGEVVDVPNDAPPEPPAPRALAFVGSESCRGCHEERHETWLSTAHAYSLRAPDERSVAGRFDGEPVDGKTFRAIPYRKGGRYYIKVESRSAQRASGDYEVTRVVGRSFEQAYLYTAPGGQWRVLPICWSIERRTWDLTHAVLGDIAGEVGDVAADFDTTQVVFNNGCGQCHATDYDVGHDARTDTYASTFLEGAVACESCHGPGAAHADWHRAERGAGQDYRWPARLVHPRDDLDAQGVLDSCGRCHYVHEWRYAIDADPRVSFADIAISSNHDKSGFYADGRLAGLNYHGSTQAQSACFREGEMSCLSCHRLHGGKRWAMKWEENDDAQCTQCHEDARYQDKAHTFHDDVRCVDCHMPRFLTGVLHFMRDHTIRSPEPELTDRYGAENAPNACNTCHDDQSARWARHWKEKWWGPTPRRLVEDVGVVMALRRDADAVETARLIALAERKESRLFFRTTALRNLAGRVEPAARAAVRRLLNDPETDIVQLACAAVVGRPDPAAVPALLQLVEGHAVRTVRVEAAYALVRAGWRGPPPPAMEAVWRETLALLERQRHFTFSLERIAMLADALDKVEEFERTCATLTRRGALRANTWPAIELTQRRARRKTEAGDHVLALDLYVHLRELLGDAAPDLLYLDSADSLAAVGKMRDALANWEHLKANAKPESTPHVIARARLAALAGKRADARTMLDDAIAKLENDPAAGEELRRLRWTRKEVDVRR